MNNDTIREELQLRIARQQSEIGTKFTTLYQSAYVPGKTAEEAQAIRDRWADELNKDIDTLASSMKELAEFYRLTSVDTVRTVRIW